ncbi:P-loop containing nucleoside triphosphate hydrolase protein [Pyrenochaeta sp. MPI-SDFR-AT-0127]|nr:P-loop containing nucleoside triphosphate hydrolase protein [Pyrenochaeta sp. MPI-SDFR-AT-0127]
MSSPYIDDTQTIIAVMGTTGVGKSTFIKYATGEDVQIGDKLVACTGKCAAHHIPHTNVWLMDTPGFDDTFRNDGEILKEINDCLSEFFHKDAKITGVLYVHAITEPRMRGSALKNLRMFREVVGPDNMRHCYLVTTKWSKQPGSVSEDREIELQSNKDFWKPLIDRGAKMVRFSDSKQSALEIIKPLAHCPQFLFKLTVEFNLENKKLDETTSGKMANEELEKAKAAFRKELDDLREDQRMALEMKDKEMLDMIETEKAKLQTEIENMKHGQELLQKKADDDRQALMDKIQSHREIQVKDKQNMKNRALRWTARAGAATVAVGATVFTAGLAAPAAVMFYGGVEGSLQAQKAKERAR